MVGFDFFIQGPGINREYCLITTGINIDPGHGTHGSQFYEFIKSVIQQRAEIVFENRLIRQVNNVDASTFLEAYDNTPRTVYQALFAMSEHSFAWTEETLTEALTSAPFFTTLNPANGHFSLDFIQSKNQGFNLYQSAESSPFAFQKSLNFFYTSEFPRDLEGSVGDILLVSDEINDPYMVIKVELDRWQLLSDYVQEQTPPGQIFTGPSSPTPQANSFWLNTTGMIFRRFNADENRWEAAPTLFVQETEPVANVGDLWLTFTSTFRMILRQKQETRFVQVPISKFTVKDRSVNSMLDGTVGENNFVIDCLPDSLTGGPLREEVRVVGEMVEQLDLTVAVNGQTTFTLPSDAEEILEFAINGIECPAFSYNASTNVLTFDPVMAEFDLEIGDKIHILYKTMSI